MSGFESSIKVSRLPSKETSSPTAHHVGNPPTSFVNPWPSFQTLSPLELAKARFGDHDFKPVPSADKLVKIQQPDWGNGKSGLKTTWIGHATVLVETPTLQGAARGVRVLFDPVFSERTSPVSFAGPKRYIQKPCEIDDLPDIDIIAISHDHYDHMDSDTLLKIHKKQKRNVHFLVGLGNAARLRGFGISVDLVTELDWWHGVHIEIEGVGTANLYCTPTQHISGRGLFDRCSTLWCSWVLETSPQSSDDEGSSTKKVFFAGDTGYRHVPKNAKEAEVPCCPAFKEIGEKLGPFDLSLLPIGLYSPRYLLSPVHCTPEDSICLHTELQSKRSIGKHGLRHKFNCT